MATPTRPLLLSYDTESDAQQHLSKQSFSQKVSTWRGIFGYLPSDETSVTKAFKDVFYDLNFFLKSPRTDRPFELSLIRQVVWVGCWNFSVLGLLIYLCLLPLGLSDAESPCQPDGEFRFGGIDRPGRFDWWAPRGFFQITLSWGRLSFGTAKLVDVIWDLVIGRGGQTLMTLVSWRVFVEYLQLSLLTKPAAYSTVWLIRFQKDNSALATWKLATGFAKVGLASKKVMCFMIWTALLILAFPTFASSMTGYTPYNKAYVNSRSGKLIQFPAIAPIAYMIRDGDRVDSLHRDYPVLWKGNSTITSRSSTELYETCDEPQDLSNVQADCQLQKDVSEYIQSYGFEGMGSQKTKHGQKTHFRNKTLNWPPLNVKAFYLPTTFYWYWTANHTDSISPAPLNPYPDITALTFLVEDEIYNVKDVQVQGICQPIKNGESIEYQWGFSFLQLFVMAILLHSWSIGLVVLWTTAHLTLQQNDIATVPEVWKSLIKMTDQIKEQLKSAGIIWENFTDKELQDEIQLLLTGGPAPTSSEESDPEKPLPQGHFSVWRWMWRHKLRLVEGMYFAAFISLENTLRSVGLYYHFDKGTFCMAVVLYAIASMIIACALGATYQQRLWTLLAAIFFKFPLLTVRRQRSRSCLTGVLPGSIPRLLSWFLKGESRCLVCGSCSL
ncbi:hypothetical protein FVEG_15207 [Fusarium verticillioides 7600]|uniref:Uncharacterized protein n=1 Tax=Gibberella moniliformis (strain M3125 / FGSC 7600) TaxID=334819 RepID=W7LNM7_GIBM7|nr:hypothetical protein FVEG_15207 [Fusarium verticillioides 7600]EWG40988.1 hypothetical protein FVEG_15207 [Fusarium verticillioides 7600]